MKQKPQVFFTDTTLRDGLQSPGLHVSAANRIRLAKLLDEIGFYLLEAGIPAMGTEEKDTVWAIKESCRHTKIAVWNRMRPEDILHSFDCQPAVIHISAPVSDLMLRGVVRRDRAWLEATLEKCVGLAREKGYMVTVGFQDASRGDIPYMIHLSRLLSRLEVSGIRLADTAGLLTPLAARTLVRRMTENTGMTYGFHGHNDFGMAVANTAEAVRAGAVYADTTLFGIGERAGNCDAYMLSQALEGLYALTPAKERLHSAAQTAKALLWGKESGSGWPAIKERKTEGADMR